jgi:hypothetical protein
VIGEKEIDRFVTAFDDVLSDLGKFPGPLWDFGQNLVKAAISQKKSSAESVPA